MINAIASSVRLRTAIVLGLTVIYAGCFVGIKAGLPDAPPLLFGALRAFIAGAVLLGLTAALRRPLLPSRDNWQWVLVLAATATTFTYGAMFLSPAQTGAGIASVMGNIQPLIATGLAATFLGEPITHRKIAAIVLGLAGVTLMTASTLRGAGWFGAAGPALALAASAGAASGSVIIKRMNPQRLLLTVTAWQLVIGSIPLFVLGALAEGSTPVRWTVPFVEVLLFLALVGTAFANAVWFWLVQHDDVGRLTTFLFLVPVLGVGFAAAIDGETVSYAEGLGLGLTLIGICIVAATPPVPQTAGPIDQTTYPELRNNVTRSWRNKRDNASDG